MNAQSNYPRPPADPNALPCPSCGQVAGKRIRYTWWGAAVGPALFNLTKCQACGFPVQSQDWPLNKERDPLVQHHRDRPCLPYRPWCNPRPKMTLRNASCNCATVCERQAARSHSVQQISPHGRTRCLTHGGQAKAKRSSGQAETHCPCD